MSVCPICVNARKLDEGTLAANATIAGSTAMFDWLGKDDATIQLLTPPSPKPTSGSARGNRLLAARIRGDHRVVVVAARRLRAA